MKKQLKGNSLGARIFLAGIFAAILLTASASLALQRVPGDLAAVDTNSWISIDPSDTNMQAALDWIDENWWASNSVQQWVTSNVPGIISNDAPGIIAAAGGVFTSDQEVVFIDGATVDVDHVDTDEIVFDNVSYTSKWDMQRGYWFHGFKGVGQATGNHQTNLNSGAWLAITGHTDSVAGGTGTAWSAYNATTGRFQPTVSGAYFVAGSAWLTSTNAALIHLQGKLAIFRNGQWHAPVFESTSNEVGDIRIGGSCIMHLNGSTHYAELMFQPDRAGAGVVCLSSTFSANYIGRGWKE